MNTPTLRPPWPMYRFLAIPLAALIGYGIFQLWGMLIPTLERVYLADYVKSALPEISIPNALELGAKAKAKRPELHVLMCYMVGGSPRPATELVSGLELRPVALRITRADFATWLRRNIYGDREPMMVLALPIGATLLMFPVLFGVGWRLDQKRHAKWRDQRILIRGPVLHNRDQFRREVKGDGIGFRTVGWRSLSEWLATIRWMGAHMCSGNWRAALRELVSGWESKTVRIQQKQETSHIALVGDTGAGKTIAIMSLADQLEERGDIVIFHDPHRQHIRRYYHPERGDIILNPSDERCAHWSPAFEVDYTSNETAENTSMALMQSWYPGQETDRDWFFTRCCRLIGSYCLTNYRPDAAQLAEMYTHFDPILDHVVKGTQLEGMVRKNAAPQRAGIEATLTAPVSSLLQIPAAEPGRPTFSARDFVRKRDGSWVFVTNTQDTRDGLRSIQTMWLDALIMQLLSVGEKEGGRRVWIVLDELRTLLRLSSLISAVSEGRKAMAIVLAYQGQGPMEVLYGKDFEGIASAPFTKLIGRTGEANAADLQSRNLGEADFKMINEHRGSDGKRSYNFVEKERIRIVGPGELPGLAPRYGYIRYLNEVLPIRLAIPQRRPDVATDYVPRVGKGAPRILPMPNLEELRQRNEEERLAEANQAAIRVPQRIPGLRGGPPKQSGLWKEGETGKCALTTTKQSDL